MPRYIDADAFVQAEIERCGSQPVVGTCTMDNEYLSIRIAAAPTLSPDDVRGVGEWIERVDYDWDIYHECSVCHTPFTMLDGTTPELNDYHYCPNCGAKMEVSEDA